MNFDLYKRLFILFFVILSITSCTFKKNGSLCASDKEIYKILDSYFKDKSYKNLQKTKNNPCIYNIQKFLAKNTKWEISSIDCNKSLCMLKVKIKEPEIGMWIKSLMKQAFLEAIKKGGVKNINERTCTILAKKIVSSNYSPKTFKVTRRKLYLKKVEGRWYVKSEQKY